MQNDCSGPRVAYDAVVWGSGESINQTSITATSLASETAIQSQISSESVALEHSCLAPHTTQSDLNHFLSRWQRDLRHLKDPHLENCMSQDGPF